MFLVPNWTLVPRLDRVFAPDYSVTSDDCKFSTALIPEHAFSSLRSLGLRIVDARGTFSIVALVYPVALAVTIDRSISTFAHIDHLLSSNALAN
jgi:hypothetical protein